eukprot:CAMPEP_0115843426 /NCGR_PEP_ID=MMETSP0287-20121206/8307_1 /TAXON_ID=412157 /ORGANISM="Chrysochromulina rotalis, Strain UIO044" /LENGTH=116 /DNA_ID=CAMNT_0003297121 /DNA_START=105 /DNA_END=451 /DNA_ORIENTATION=+
MATHAALALPRHARPHALPPPGPRIYVSPPPPGRSGSALRAERRRRGAKYRQWQPSACVTALARKTPRHVPAGVELACVHFWLQPGNERRRRASRHACPVCRRLATAAAAAAAAAA